jgi:cell wall-associated NlpC family hydrolase
MTRASELVRAAREMRDIPFRHQGRSTASGLDCLGLLLLAGERAGVLQRGIEHADYGRAPQAALEERLAHHCDRLEVPEPGAVIAIKWPGDKRAGHVAICTEAQPAQIIHSYSYVGRVVEHGYRGHWPRWTRSIWWLRGLNRG